MIDQLQNWASNPYNMLLATMVLQVVLFFGLWLQQLNFRKLIGILDSSNKNNADMIKLNGSIHKNETAAVNNCKHLNQVNWELKRKLERYEDIYGPLNTES